MEGEQQYDTSPIFDSFDIDLVVKHLSHTVFSPFFTFLFPVFFLFQGLHWSDPAVLATVGYNLVLCAFWFLKWCSRLYRNQGSLLFGQPPLDWGEQVVVITGGSSGIGELIANTLAVRNVTVIVLDIKPIITENFNITYYKCDVSKWEEVEAVSKKITDEIGHPTILINNAGVVQGKLLVDLTAADIQQTFSVNTLAHFWTLKAFLPHMIKQNSGHIINMASVTGLVGMAKMTDYNASKAALISLHESLRYELDHKYHAPSVRTTLMIPGHVVTGLFSTVQLPVSPLHRFFFPSLAPVTVVKAVITALDEQHSRTIYLPFFANFTPLFPLFPSFLRDLAQWVSGCDYAMDDFVKVNSRRSEEVPPAGAESEASTKRG
ncbi:Dehydrogenase RED2 [Sparassis crispa]|uniref:Short-chain dehydrogenase/reductase 3 n=1 Tax=Sparassis crispa TaxID=139825 RepID=A0A401GCQ7_9APHY|nr:Dehydrogenase RED2 [Sparassis crispa]GBE79942.1 Dehydrogenase RED2 [Sparassis crispa]